MCKISAIGSWDDGTKTLTGAGTVAGISTNCVVTVTSASWVHTAGLVIEDDTDYFLSNISRAGMNWVGATQGWTISVAVVGLAGAYAMGIGSVMARLIPVYDRSKQEVVSGFLEYELQNGDIFDTAKTYRKYVFVITEGDEDAMAGENQNTDQEVILYCDKASGNLGDLDTAIQALT